jgi:hypothetical protein
MFGLMEQNGTERNEIKWNGMEWSGMERNGTMTPFHCLDIV